MRGKATRTRLFLRLALAVVWAYGCEGPRPDAEDPLGHAVSLTSDLAVGAEIDAAPEFQFVDIKGLLLLEKGSFWILDGYDQQDASIRRYDASGTFLGYVSGPGDGPGEFRRPWQLAELEDGRVLLTDQLFPRRLTIFDLDGTLDTVVAVPDEYALGLATNTFVDDTGLIWRWSSTRARPGPDPPPPFWSRRRVDGTFVDTVHPPDLPELNTERVAYESDDGRTVRGFSLPYRPRGHWAVRRSGEFLIAPRDEYRVYRLDRDEGRGGTTKELFTSRDIPRVAIFASERAALVEETRADIADFARERRLSLDLEVPEVPSEKPFLRGLITLKDGSDRIMVKVSMPSVQTPSGWMEPSGWDVFDGDGRFIGRVVLPIGHRFMHARDDKLWTIFTDEFGIESLHRHPLPF